MFKPLCVCVCMKGVCSNMCTCKECVFKHIYVQGCVGESVCVQLCVQEYIDLCERECVCVFHPKGVRVCVYAAGAPICKLVSREGVLYIQGYVGVCVHTHMYVHAPCCCFSVPSKAQLGPPAISLIQTVGWEFPFAYGCVIFTMRVQSLSPWLADSAPNPIKYSNAILFSNFMPT